MDMFEFVTGIGDSVCAESGIHKIETSRGLVWIDVEEDGIQIPFSVKIKQNLTYTDQISEVNLIDVTEETEEIMIGYYTLETSYIISEDEVLIIYWRWYHFLPVGVIVLLREPSQN